LDLEPARQTLGSPPIRLRELVARDCAVIAQAFAAQGWDKPEAQYRRYLEECRAGTRVVFVAEVETDAAPQFAGYVCILWESDYAPFREAAIPEIADFNVLIAFQRRGIGTALMDAAEQRIATRSPLAGLGVGLTADYGAAQVMYARRGYVPDGRGLFHAGQPAHSGQLVPVDDDLNLFLVCRLRP
jgi:GNAT superfamily N-acetyltransferase